MQSKSDRGRCKTPLSRRVLRGIAAELGALESQFARLRENPDGPLFFVQAQAATAQAGRHLLRLLLHGAIEGPSVVPRWLSWSLPFGARRPTFTASRGYTTYLCHPARRVSEMLMILAEQLPEEHKRLRPTTADRLSAHRHHYVFLEALGWLGRRCVPRVVVKLPTVDLEVAARGDSKPQLVSVAVDWKGHTRDQWKLLFIEIAGAAAAICRLLVTQLNQAAERSIPDELWPPALATAVAAFRKAHDDWKRTIPRVGLVALSLTPDGRASKIEFLLPTGEAVKATPEEQCRSFGFAMTDWSSQPQPVLPPTNAVWRARYDACAAVRVDLASAADRLAAAVTGTDESASHLRLGALRLAKLLRSVPPVWPTRVEVDLAREIKDVRIGELRRAMKEAERRREEAEAAATEERRKQKAELANDALIAWHEAQKSTSPDAPAEGPVLKFGRAPDAKQKCLEALAAASNGIPTHQNIANATGLEHQTVKEAMPKLKDAGHVEKRDRAWFITESGRAHLRMLRGE